jgi:hypothetical protein
MEEKSSTITYEQTEAGLTPATTKVEDAVQLAAEVDEARYSPWAPHMWKLYAVLWVAYLCGCLNGFDGSLMGGINAMTTYQDYFHLCVEAQSSLSSRQRLTRL